MSDDFTTQEPEPAKFNLEHAQMMSRYAELHTRFQRNVHETMRIKAAAKAFIDTIPHIVVAEWVGEKGGVEEFSKKLNVLYKLIKEVGDGEGEE